MIDHGDLVKAYQTAYPNAKVDTARVNGSRLLRKATIAQAIDHAVKQRQGLIESVKTEQTIVAVKNGLKSKTDRVLTLQRQIDSIQKELEDNIDPGYIVIGGKPQKINKEIAMRDRALMRKVLRELQAEVSKLEGDYPALRHEHTGKDGGAIKTEVTRKSNIDLNKLPSSALEAVINARTTNTDVV